MTPTPTPSADAITVAQTLELLDTRFSGLATGVADGLYIFWLGSGISRGRAANLWQVVVKVVEFLRKRIDVRSPDCEYGRAFAKAVDLAGLEAAERARIDAGVPVASWAGGLGDVVISRLVMRYSELLDLRIKGQPADYLLWDGVDVRGSYRPGLEPDCEHICLAVLALEGVLPEVASANWDGLIESAICELVVDPDQALVVCILEEDLRKSVRLTRLLKFHGCAVRAADDPATYRERLVARKTQIAKWIRDGNHKLMREELQGLAAKRPMLMVGLSAQDSDIQDVFVEAQEKLAWVWEANPVSHVFAGDTLGVEQETILKVVFNDEYEAHGPEIEYQALIRAYAKPLLTALVLHVLCAKLRAFARTADAPNLDLSARDEIDAGIQWLRDRAAELADPDHLGFVRRLADVHGTTVAFFQDGVRPVPTTKPPYRALSAVPLDRVRYEPALTTGGVPELASALGLLGTGARSGRWEISINTSSAGIENVITVTAASGATPVYFAANATSAARLLSTGVIDSASADAVVIHSKEVPPAQTRSPMGAYGRTAGGRPREVGMAGLLNAARSGTDLADAFRREAAL